jgi:hypothetical protein
MEENDFPALYRSANDLSLISQVNFFTALRIHLFTLVLAAILSVINIPHWSIAALQVFALIGALSCSIYLFSVRPEKLWYGGRAVAESIKTITWRYVCRAEPFEGNDESAQKSFRQTLKAVIDQNRDVCGKLSNYLDESQISNKMNEIRSQTLSERKTVYLNNRISDQHKWYASKSKSNRLKARYFSFSLIIVNLLALSCAVLRVANVEVSFWPTDIFVSIAAGILSWMQAKKFSELAASYSLASYEIGLIKEEAEQPNTEDTFSKYVGNSENAFSREHTQWIARKDI